MQVNPNLHSVIIEERHLLMDILNHNLSYFAKVHFTRKLPIQILK